MKTHALHCYDCLETFKIFRIANLSTYIFSALLNEKLIMNLIHYNPDTSVKREKKIGARFKLQQHSTVNFAFFSAETHRHLSLVDTYYNTICVHVVVIKMHVE